MIFPKNSGVLAFALLLAALLFAAPARADQPQAAATQPDPGAHTVDPAASFVTRLFLKACTPNMGQPGNTRAWASGQHLRLITDPAPLQVFVGEGNKGSAWAVPAAAGSFALSIRGTTEACAVWAKEADPADVENDFTKIITGVKRPGIDLQVYEDKTVGSPHGKVRELIYLLSATDNPTMGFLFTMQTVEHPGGAFQASLQVARTIMPERGGPDGGASSSPQ